MRGASIERQRGIAIIMAVLISAMVAAIAFVLAGRERLWLFQIENQRDITIAHSVSIGAINLARLTIRDDGRSNQVDHLGEPWNTPIPAINVEDGKVAGQLIEAQGRFNLNNLVKNNEVDALAVAALRRLLKSQGLSSNLADEFAKFIEQRIRLKPDEQPDLRSLPVDMGELAVVSGMNAEIVRQLESWVVVLPEATPINVNFVSPEILVALVPGLSLSEAQSVLTARAANPFTSVAMFLDAVPQDKRSQFEKWSWTVQSDYFFITTESWFGRVYLRHQALLKRNGRENASVVWLKRIYDGR